MRMSCPVQSYETHFRFSSQSSESPGLDSGLYTSKYFTMIIRYPQLNRSTCRNHLFFDTDNLRENPYRQQSEGTFRLIMFDSNIV